MPRRKGDEQSRLLQQQSKITAYLTGEIRSGRHYFHSKDIADAVDVPIRTVSSYLSFLKRCPDAGIFQINIRSFTRSTTWEIYDKSVETVPDTLKTQIGKAEENTLALQSSAGEELS